jgi:hypothetical protein
MTTCHSYFYSYFLDFLIDFWVIPGYFELERVKGIESSTWF